MRATFLPTAASETAVNPGTQKTIPEPPSQTGLSQDGQTLQPPGNPALLTADPNTIADSVASTATDSIINTPDITEGVQSPGTGGNAVALDNAPTPEQQIAHLAEGITQQRGVTSGRATIAAQEMYTEAEKRFGSDRDAVLAAYQPGQNPKQFLDGFQNAYIAGTLESPSALENSKAAAYLMQEQRDLAYDLGWQKIESKLDNNTWQRYNDNIEILSLRFISNRDRLYTNSGKVSPLDGYEDIVCHADPYSFGFVDPDSEKTTYEMDAVAFAQQVRESGLYNDGAIRLMACESGMYTKGLAQQFANAMGKPILAPTGMLYIDSDGRMVVAKTEEEALKKLKKLDGKWDPEGWKLFEPQGE